jgi:cell division protein FtsN
MAREYGSRRPARRSNSAPKQLLIVAVTFLIGYFTASIFDINALSHWMNTQVLASHEVKKQELKSHTQHAQAPAKPKFEFYTLLANDKRVGVAQNNTPHPTTTAPGPSTQVQTASSTVVTGVTTATHSVPNKSSQGAVTSLKHAPVQVAEGKPLAPGNSSNKGYLVQVASFKMRKDAEHMKGLLTLKGFDVNVVPVSQPQGNWFRVVIGPYANRGLAQKAQVTLAKTERLHGMVRSAG